MQVGRNWGSDVSFRGCKDLHDWDRRYEQYRIGLADGSFAFRSG